MPNKIKEGDLEWQVTRDYVIERQTQIFHATIKKLRAKEQSEDFTKSLELLEKEFQEYIETWIKVFEDHGMGAGLKRVAKRIPKNSWLKLILVTARKEGHAVVTTRDPVLIKQFEKDLHRKKHGFDVM